MITTMCFICPLPLVACRTSEVADCGGSAPAYEDGPLPEQPAVIPRAISAKSSLMIMAPHTPVSKGLPLKKPSLGLRASRRSPPPRGEMRLIFAMSLALNLNFLVSGAVEQADLDRLQIQDALNAAKDGFVDGPFGAQFDQPMPLRIEKPAFDAPECCRRFRGALGAL